VFFLFLSVLVRSSFLHYLCCFNSPMVALTPVTRVKPDVDSSYHHGLNPTTLFRKPAHDVFFLQPVFPPFWWPRFARLRWRFRLTDVVPFCTPPSTSISIPGRCGKMGCFWVQQRSHIDLQWPPGSESPKHCSRDWWRQPSCWVQSLIICSTHVP
jgi:hypothetical protein